MKVTVVYLGGSRQQAGVDRETLEVADRATVGQVAAAVAAAHPALAPLLPSVRWAVNHEFADADAALGDGDEIALLPPVAGGAPRAEVVDEPIDVAAVMARVTDPAHGGIVLFVGTVRDNARGKSVHAIEYEAYRPMAEKQLDRIAEECSRDGADVVISHRQGNLAVGDVAVVIAAAAPHREEAFAACREAIERIKKDVPIWKKEHAEGGEVWVGWGGG